MSKLRTCELHLTPCGLWSHLHHKTAFPQLWSWASDYILLINCSEINSKKPSSICPDSHTQIPSLSIKSQWWAAEKKKKRERIFVPPILIFQFVPLHRLVFTHRSHKSGLSLLWLLVVRPDEYWYVASALSTLNTFANFPPANSTR